MAKNKEMHATHFSEFITTISREIYKQIHSLLKDTEYEIRDQYAAWSTCIWLDCFAVQVLKNAGYSDEADMLRHHRTELVLSTWPLKRTYVDKMYEQYEAVEHRMLVNQVFKGGSSFYSYLESARSIGVERTIKNFEIITISTEFGVILANYADAVTEFVGDYKIVE